MKIFKYNLSDQYVQVVKLPRGARILSVQNQSSNLCLWAEVNEVQEEEEHVEAEIRIIGTGNSIKIDLDMFNHIDTVIVGHLVWHVYICGRDLASSFLLKNEGRTHAGD